MSIVSTEFLARWRQAVATLTGGPATRMQHPVAQVFVRRGYFRHQNIPWTGPDVNAYVVAEGADNDNPWQATWHSLTDWIELPDVESIEIEHELEARTASVTIVVGDSVLDEQTGVSSGFAPFGGIYHAIERGWLAPWRGSDTEFTPPPADAANEWYRLLDQKMQVKVWQGYGADEVVPTFIGFIDDLDMVSVPDQITITARDTSQHITDSRCYGWSKEKSFPDPVTFADRISHEDTTKVGDNANASSEQVGYEADNILDGDSTTHWRSDDKPVSNFTEWVEIDIPDGRYESFRINTENYSGMTGYIAINSTNGTVDGVPVADGWIDGGLGTVPGANGGFEYVKTFTTSDGVKTPRLPFVFIGSGRLRIAFRDLKSKGDDYRAGVVALKAIERELPSEDALDGWILVDDACDIVRVILRWCGYKDFDVEDSDMRLEHKKTYNRGDFLMDIVEDVIEQTGFVFYVRDPTDDPDSLGFPVFRRNRALVDIDAEDIPVIQDTDLLARASVRFTSEPLAHIIRVRGRTATKDEGGIVVSRDQRRLVAVYRPPWAIPGDGTKPRTASIYRRTFLDRWRIKRQEQLEYAARLVALYQVLAANTAAVELPANPGIGLDQHVLLADRATGLNTRLWTASRSSSFAAGTEQPHWTMSIAGSLLDTPDMERMRAEVRELENGDI